MDIKKFVLSYYKNATEDFHVTRITCPQEALKLHSHDYFQIYYVVSGKIIHHIEHNYAELCSGDVFILPPNLSHYIEMASEVVDFYSLSFMPEFVQRNTESNRMVADFLYYLKTVQPDNIHPKFSFGYEDTFFINLMFERILKEFQENKTGKNDMLKGNVMILLTLFARVYFEEQAEALTTQENKRLVIHCIEYIKTHFNEDITLSNIVHHCGMSKTCFCSLFNSMVGTSFKDYLNQYRINRAVDYLTCGEKLANVCSYCGYNDFSTFYRNFKKYMGVSPSEFVKGNDIQLP